MARFLIDYTDKKEDVNMDNNFTNNNEQNITGTQPMYQMNQAPVVKAPKKPKKKGGFSKFMKVVACAVCFGFISGGVMFGVEWAGGELVNNGNSTSTNKEVSTTNTSTSNKVAVTNSTTDGSSATTVTDVSGVVDEVMPSIVAITSTQIVDPGYSFWFSDGGSYTQEGAGSGIIVGKSDTELLIVTNNHVVADADTLSVQFINEKSVDAYIKGTDAANDLAVVSIPLDTIDSDTIDAIKIATLGDSDSLSVGEGAIAIGNALGYGQSVTSGVISAVNREVTVENNTLTLLQTDAAINPGNSGGALLNMKGEVIGINAAKYSSDSVEGMGFAIPISSAKEIINNLMNQETKMKVDEAKRGYLGINGTDVDSNSSQMYGIPTGVYVYSTVENGPAAKADIVKGDVITAINGTTVTTLSELKSELEYYESGEEVELTVQVPEGSSYTEKKITVTLEKSTETSSSNQNQKQPTN